MTDILITINKEDFNRAKKHFHAKKIEYVPGVGIDVDKFANCKVDVKIKRKELGIPEDAFLIISVGELNENKNHQLVIEALKKLKNIDIYYMIVGDGPLHDNLNSLVKKFGLIGRVKILGYRSDVAELLKISNLFIHPSHREGLPVAVMEALCSGIPVVVSDIRGCRDLVSKSNTFKTYSEESLNLLINRAHDNPVLYRKCSLVSINNLSHKYINHIIEHIYFSFD